MIHNYLTSTYKLKQVEEKAHLVRTLERGTESNMFVFASSSSLSSEDEPTAWMLSDAIVRRDVRFGDAFIFPVKKVSSSRRNLSPPRVGDFEGSSDSELLQLLPDGYEQLQT